MLVWLPAPFVSLVLLAFAGLSSTLGCGGKKKQSDATSTSKPPDTGSGSSTPATTPDEAKKAETAADPRKADTATDPKSKHQQDKSKSKNLKATEKPVCDKSSGKDDADIVDKKDGEKDEDEKDKPGQAKKAEAKSNENANATNSKDGDEKKDDAPNMPTLDQLKPRKFENTKKEKQIKETNAKKKRTDYPTFGDVHSDWGSVKENKGETDKKDDKEVPKTSKSGEAVGPGKKAGNKSQETQQGSKQADDHLKQSAAKPDDEAEHKEHEKPRSVSFVT